MPRENHQKKSHPLAIEILERHLDAQPSSLNLKVRQGILMFSAKRYAEGVLALKQVLAVHPKKALAHESLAKYYRQEGMKGEARIQAAELLKIRGGSPEDFLKLAGEMEEDNDFRAARLLLEKAVFHHEEDASLMMKLAIVTAKDPEAKALAARLFKDAEAMLAGNPAKMDPAFILQSAKELVSQGETKAAEDRLRTAIRSFPKNAKKESAAAMRALAGIWISERPQPRRREVAHHARRVLGKMIPVFGGGDFSFLRAMLWFHPGMRMFTALLVFAALLVISPSASAGGSKGKTARISFHMETEGTDNPKMIFPHEVFEKQRFFRRIPDISSKDLVAFSPFPADDQASYGAMFQLKGAAQRRLAAVTADNIGKWFVCMAFGRIVDGVLVDEPVNDGAIVIWRGLTLGEIKEIDKTMPRIGETEKR